VAAVDPLGNRGVADLKEIVQLVEDDLVKVEELFEVQCRSDVGLVGEIGRYIREGGGKRIRPALLLLACRTCGFRGERAIVLASVVEFIHTATLLHDDIIDQATVRRGRRSVNIEGELLEIERNGDVAMREADHLDIIRRKTADLFSACMRIGAMLGEAGEEREKALAAYGLNLGVCFQMVDDLLDFTADEKVLGKPVASDLREGKLTLPVIYMLRRAGPAGAEMVSAVLADRGFERVSREEFLKLIRDHGALDEARSAAERYAEAARRDLLGFDRSPYREALEVLPDFILARDH
jgi:octaprenyl-diphosphate synthase